MGRSAGNGDTSADKEADWGGRPIGEGTEMRQQVGGAVAEGVRWRKGVEVGGRRGRPSFDVDVAQRRGGRSGDGDVFRQMREGSTGAKTA